MIFSLTFAHAIDAGQSGIASGATFLLAALMLLGTAVVAERATRVRSPA